tara:strand:+ start:1301 stop:1489 length:189 start_codon:yes stop_codon:yes gene_type:complete
MTIPKTNIITTQQEARQLAIEWQSYFTESNLSYGDLADWQAFFQELAEKFNLVEEFKENAII